MTSFVSHPTVDCADAYQLSEWWKGLLGYVDPRLHFDLRSREGTRDDEIERVRASGAREVSDHRGQYGPGSGWVVFADPEGNEFCILRSQDELRDK